MRTPEILSLLRGVRPCGHNRFLTLCPAHEDHNPSMSLMQADDRTLIHCHAGCPAEAICAALGITLVDLFDG